MFDENVSLIEQMVDYVINKDCKVKSLIVTDSSYFSNILFCIKEKLEECDVLYQYDWSGIGLVVFYVSNKNKSILVIHKTYDVPDDRFDRILYIDVEENVYRKRFRKCMASGCVVINGKKSDAE